MRPSHTPLAIRVLVADDEQPLRDAVSALIDDDAECEVVGHAASAEEALALIHELEPDVALVDVKMPLGGGVRVAQELTLNGSPTRVVAFSASSDRATIVRLLRAGAVGYLVKGSSSAEVLEAIKRAVRGQGSLATEMLLGVVDVLSGQIAEQRAAHQIQRHQDDRTRGVLESAPDAVLVADERGEIMLVNAQTERMFGYDRSELIGRPVELLVPERFSARHIDHRAGYAADPRTRDMGLGLELAGRRRDGSEFPVDISLAGEDTGDGVVVIAFIRDATQRKAQEEAARRNAERRALLRHLVSAAEEERRRIAADIHDDSIQAMAAASIRLQIVRRRVTEPAALDLLDELAQTVDLAIERLRHLLFELCPPALDREGIAPAIALYLREAGTDIEYALDERLRREPPPETRVILYRLAQEALTNVRKHAHAGRAEVLLDEYDGGYRLRITDDGVGFVIDADVAAPGHLGLAVMRERAELAGGSLRVASVPGRGTTVECWLPGEVTADVPA